MSDRTRRSTAQPKSYKQFNEKGREAISETSVSERHDLLMEQLSDENRELSGDNSEVLINPQAQTQASSKKAKSRHAVHTQSRSCKHDSNSSSFTAEHSNEEASSTDMDDSQSINELDIHVNAADDDLDKDTGRKTTRNTNKNSNLMVSSPTKRSAIHDNEINEKDSPKKKGKKQTVAARLKQSISTPVNKTPKTPRKNLVFATLGNRDPEAEFEEAQDQLRQAQKDVENARKRLQAEEACRKALLLQKQVDQDNQKADRE